MFTQGPALWAGIVTPPIIDQFFKNVKLLVPAVGANNSTSFTDVSSTGNTVTAVGNTKISSNYALLDGSGDYLSVPNSADWRLGNGDFTIEATIDSYTSVTSENIFIGMWLNGGQLSWLSTINNTNKLTFYYSSDGGTGTFTPVTTSSVSTAGGPIHLAITRANNVIRLFINGVKGYEGAITATLFAGTHTLTIGGVTYQSPGLSAKLRNIRITKGVARYVADFTPHAATAVLGTTAPTVPVRFYENDSVTTVSGTGNRVLTITSASTFFGVGQVSDITGANVQATQTGKTYIEFTIGGDSTGMYIGIAANSQFSGGFAPGNPLGTTGSYVMTNIGYNGVVVGLVTNGTNTANSVYDFALGDVIGMAVDWDAKKIWFRKASSGWISGDPVAGTSPTFTFSDAASTIVVGAYTRSSFTYTATIAESFKYTPPAGFGRYIHANSTSS